MVRQLASRVKGWRKRRAGTPVGRKGGPGFLVRECCGVVTLRGQHAGDKLQQLFGARVEAGFQEPSAAREPVPSIARKFQALLCLL